MSAADVFGAVLDKAPQDWQILQRGAGGTADIPLGGRWRDPDGGKGDVYARVVDEQTGAPAVPWHPCATQASGRWDTVLEGVPAGGLYRIETCLARPGQNPSAWGGPAARGDMRHHIGVGDVYVIAGQSNSAGYGWDFTYDPPEPGVHLLRNNGQWDMAAHPLNESTDTLHDVNREHINPGHSPWLCFAKRLKARLGIPVGLVQASLGGSALAAWDPADLGHLYASMRNTLRENGDTVKGILWYQGESDCPAPLCHTYQERFRDMIFCWRDDFGQPDMPFLTVQLSRFIVPAKNDEGWGIVREAQRRAAREINNVFVIPSTDTGLSDAIHISAAGNMTLGERMAGVALKHVYGQSGGYDVPDIIEAKKIDGSSVRLTFGPLSGSFYVYEVPACDLPFEVVDDAGRIEIVEYELSGPSIILRLAREPGPGCHVSGAARQDPLRITPVDFSMHMPILSFYRYPVT